MIENKLKVGIAGYGVVGKRRRYYIDKNPYFKTVAICDQYFDNSGVMDDGVKFHRQYQELLKEPLDVLFVSLPNYIAADVTKAGLAQGFHVFCEKPPGRDVADIQSVIEIEKQHPDTLLKYGFNHRYHDSVKEALRIIESGELGQIVNLRGVYGKSKIIPFSGGWRAERKYSGGGILLDQGIHMVDLIRLFCGCEFVDIQSFISNQYWHHDVEDNAYAMMKDEKGRIALIHSSATQWQHRFSLEIALTEGYLELKGLLTGSKSYGRERLVIGRRDEADTGSQRDEILNYLEDNSWRDEVNEFADAVVHQHPIEYGSSKEALATMKLIYQIYCADPKWKSTYHIEQPDS